MFVTPPVPSRQLRPFLPDRKLPQEQEFMVIGAREPRAFLRQWSNGPRHCQELSFSTQLDCKLLEYRNVTHLQLLQPCVLQVELNYLYWFYVCKDILVFKAFIRKCEKKTSFTIWFLVCFRARLQPPTAPWTSHWMWMCLWNRCSSVSASMPSTLWTLPCTAGNRWQVMARL